MSEKKIILETDRLILRRYCKEDLQNLYEYLSDEEVVKYEPYKPIRYYTNFCFPKSWIG